MTFLEHLTSLMLASCFLVFTLWIPIDAEDVFVDTKYGRVLGRKITYPNAPGSISSVHRFLGVPYAKPPVNKLRFSPPIKPSAWKYKIHNATKFKDACMQNAFTARRLWPYLRLTFNEDCLYLDIYTPGRSSAQYSILSPVMVYIHGGGYEIGTPRIYPGEILPLWDVVLVQVQYRLGPFGFLHTEHKELRGNYGMLDQVQALKWVQENIQSFGGDPNKVTIFGESAGGSSVSLHLLSPLSKELFHRAIAISGVDLSPFAHSPNDKALKSSETLLRQLNCSKSDPNKMLECLRTTNTKHFRLDTKPNIWGPVVDKVFLPDTPQNLRKSGAFHKIPFMAGFTSDDGSLYFPAAMNISQVNSNTFKTIIGWLLSGLRRVFEFQTDTSDFLTESVQLYYRPWPETKNDRRYLRRITEFLTDYLFAAPVDQTLAFHSQSAPAYMYEFSHLSKLHFNPQWMGVTHLHDMPYYFGFPLMNLTVLQTYDEADRNLSRIVIELFTTFAKYGKTPEKIAWKQFDYTQRSFLRIQQKPEIRKRYHPCQMAFWDRIYPVLLKTERQTVSVLVQTESPISAASTYRGVVHLLLSLVTSHTLLYLTSSLTIMT